MYKKQKLTLTGYLSIACIIAIVWITCSPSYSQKEKQQPQERLYYFAVPESLARQTALLLQGNDDQISAKDFKEIQQITISQYLNQSRQYYLQDSIEAAQRLKPKPDTTLHK